MSTSVTSANTSGKRWISRKIDDGLIENIIYEGTCIEKEDIEKIKESNTAIAHGSKYCVLVNSEALTSISKEARELTASKNFQQDTIAKALMVNTLGQRIVGNFYLRVNKPAIKTSLFTDRDKAIEWLKAQLRKN